MTHEHWKRRLTSVLKRLQLISEAAPEPLSQPAGVEAIEIRIGHFNVGEFSILKSLVGERIIVFRHTVDTPAGCLPGKTANILGY